jgi:hypothetical protein
VRRTIPITALKKPRHGQPCNGCGYCCLSETCLLGQELGNTGRCKALESKSDGSYVCGLIADPYRYLPENKASSWRRIDAIKEGAGIDALKAYDRQMLGAGRGCDSYKG